MLFYVYLSYLQTNKASPRVNVLGDEMLVFYLQCLACLFKTAKIVQHSSGQHQNSSRDNYNMPHAISHAQKLTRILQWTVIIDSITRESGGN